MPPPSESLLASFRKLRQLLNRRDKIGFGILLLGMIGAAALEVVSVGTVPVFVMREAARQTTERFSWEAYQDRTIEFYRQIASDRGFALDSQSPFLRSTLPVGS